jgi:glucose-6-phosphate isomerase
MRDRGDLTKGADQAMSDLLQYDPAAADAVLDAAARETVVQRLVTARETLLGDLTDPPTSTSFNPLDIDFVDWPEKMLADDTELSRIEETASAFRDQNDEIVLLGIGGSSMGPRALFSALCDPFHNERPRQARGDSPRVYFEGDNLDNNSLVALLDRLAQLAGRRWALLVTSKSGNTLETAVALRVFLAALESRFEDPAEVPGALAVMTGAESRLREMARTIGCENIFSLPERIGGRFSILTAVGLLPAAILGLDIRQLLAGALATTRRFRETDPGNNPVLDHAATSITAEEHHGLSIRVLSVWTKALEPLGLWHDQLLSESLGKDGRGATPLTVVNTRDLHSRGQQHQDGRRDKLITNLLIDDPGSTPLVIPARADDSDGLNRLAGRTMPELLGAAIRGTNQAYAQDRRPTADIRLPRLDEFTVGQLVQMLMLSVTLEGYATGINPFGQPGVEGYKRQMHKELDG